ncbi:MAG: hypothetical protein R3C19_11515 [Planctomycetaceae bacterium]
MTRSLFLASTLLAVIASSPMSVEANDIVDFLKAVRGPSRPHRQVRGPVVVESVGHRGHGNPAIHAAASHHAGGAHWSAGSRNFGRGQTAYRRPITIGNRSRTTVSLQIGGTFPIVPPAPVPAPVYTVPPVPTYPVVPAPAPVHEIGCIVTCPVPLERHVVVFNAQEIAPGAVPVTVAVRNPHLGPFGSPGCVESLVYVQVFVPPCPLQKLKVSPCRTMVELDYGDYEVEIRSCDGHIDVEYHD